MDFLPKKFLFERPFFVFVKVNFDELLGATEWAWKVGDRDQLGQYVR